MRLVISSPNNWSMHVVGTDTAQRFSEGQESSRSQRCSRAG